jgi:hypothetical protein
VARYAEQGVIPIPPDQLWRFLELHARDDVISSIHPDVLSQQTIDRQGDAALVERTLRFRGKPRPTRWRISWAPPERSRWEIIDAPEGPMAKGSWVENRYSEVPTGTLVVTEADITVVGFPRFLQSRLARTVLNRIDAQDLAYLRRSR